MSPSSNNRVFGLWLGFFCDSLPPLPTSEPTSLFKLLFAKNHRRDRSDENTCSCTISPDPIMIAFGIQQAGSLWLKMIAFDRVSHNLHPFFWASLLSPQDTVFGGFFHTLCLYQERCGAYKLISSESWCPFSMGLIRKEYRLSFAQISSFSYKSSNNEWWCASWLHIQCMKSTWKVVENNDNVLKCAINGIASWTTWRVRR